MFMPVTTAGTIEQVITVLVPNADVIMIVVVSAGVLIHPPPAFVSDIAVVVPFAPIVETVAIAPLPLP
jgi:hypothetical protein